MDKLANGESYGELYGVSKRATEEALAWLRSVTGATHNLPLSQHIKLARKAKAEEVGVPAEKLQAFKEAITTRLQLSDEHAKRALDQGLCGDGFDEKHWNAIEILADILFMLCPHLDKRTKAPQAFKSLPTPPPTPPRPSSPSSHFYAYLKLVEYSPHYPQPPPPFAPLTPNPEPALSGYDYSPKPQLPGSTTPSPGFDCRKFPAAAYWNQFSF